MIPTDPSVPASNVKSAESVRSAENAFAAIKPIPEPEKNAPGLSVKTAVSAAETDVVRRIAHVSSARRPVAALYAQVAVSVQSAESAIVTTVVNQTATVKNVRTAISVAYANLNVDVTRVLTENPTARARNAQDAMYVLYAANAIAVIREQAVTE